MKNIILIVIFLISGTSSFSQAKIDQDRMDRDIEIAENALATIIKQKFGNRNMWLEVKATYTPGYGVTMRLPNDNHQWSYNSGFGVGNSYSYSISSNGNGNGRAVIAPVPAVSANGTNVIVYRSADDDYAEAPKKAKGEKDKDREFKDYEKDKAKAMEKAEKSSDSARAMYYGKMIDAAIEFIVDYGDLFSQLPPEERILITNRGEGGRFYEYNNKQKRMLVTVEGTKGDIVQFRQGKMTRDQIMKNVKIVNTESTNEVETDLELLSSILSRLYRSDLSKTFYTEENIYYERLKNFGVIYYMSAYSSNEQYRNVDRNTEASKDKGKIWSMPTLRLEGLTQEQRDKKVIEMYPQFERELKDNIVEYAQTVKSLKDEEMFVFNIQITKCVGCNIPSTLELSLKNSLVRKLAAGQATKAEVVAAINVKKGPTQ
ncbi:MAG: hypothetical protein WDO15_17845 [Bacteroidota bacterium]